MPSSPRRAVPTARAATLAVATATSLLLAGCASIDEDDVRAIGDLPGIDYAISSCDLASCRVSVRAEPDASAEELLAALTAARATEPDVLTLDSDGAGGIEVDGESPAGDDEAAVDLAVEGIRLSGVDGFSVTIREDGVGVTVSGDGSRPVWDVAEQLWPDVEPLASPVLTVSQGAGGPAGDTRPSRVVADGELPAEGIALARSIEEQDLAGYTGAVVTGDGVVLGARGVAQAEELEALAVREAPGLDVEVVVSTNVLDQRPGSGDGSEGGQGDGPSADPDEATEEDRRTVLAVLEADLGAYPRVEQGTVLLGGSDLVALADLVDTVRATEPDAASRVPITVGTTLDAGALGFDGPVSPGTAPFSVRLGTDGSTDLVRLAALLRAQPDVGGFELRAPDPDDDEDEDVRDAGLTVQVAATDLSGGVRRVAAVVTAWSTGLTDLEVGVTAVDPEGRSPGVRLVVERQGERWVATGGTDHQTQERVAEGVTAWQAGAVTP